MNVGALLDFAMPDAAALPRRAPTASGPSAFAESLTAEREKPVHRFIQGPGFFLRMGESILCSGGVGGAWIALSGWRRRERMNRWYRWFLRCQIFFVLH